MMDDGRPNIITVGVLTGAVVQMVVWLWNGALSSLPPMGAGEAAALTTIVTAMVQWLDRRSKRRHNHVLTKYGRDEGQP
jgi:hypothetical protein